MKPNQSEEEDRVSELRERENDGIENRVGVNETNVWRVKEDTATDRMRREGAPCDGERETALGNDPKVRQEIKHRWLPVTNLAPVSTERPHWGHFLGA